MVPPNMIDLIYIVAMYEITFWCVREVEKYCTNVRPRGKKYTFALSNRLSYLLLTTALAAAAMGD